MQEKEQAYAKASFSDVANKYDQIPFFKTSAKHVAQLINRYKDDDTLEILDVACGTGNVVMECASSISSAHFDAVDISEGMLAKAQENALKRNLTNITFHLQDITKLTLEKKYDVITCSYALFFLPDPHQILKMLSDLLKTDGMVVFTSFVKNAFAPSNEILLPLLRAFGSPSAQAYEMDKWENLQCTEDIERLCNLAGLENVQIESKEIRYGMSIDAWWELLNNTGYKGMLMELGTEEYTLTKHAYYEEMFKHADMDGEVELIADTYFVIVS